MTANQVFLVVLFVFLVVQLIFVAIAIKSGLKWAGVAEVSYKRALGLLLVLFIVGSAAAALAELALTPAAKILTPTFEFLLCLAIKFFAIFLAVARIYKVPFVRSMKSLIPYVLLTAAMLLLAVFVIRPYVYAGFFLPTDSMAPTLLGTHWEAPCPRCDAPAYGEPIEILYRRPIDPREPLPPEGVPMVCSKELTTVYVKDRPKKRGSSDFFLVCKLLKPRRWDIIAFRYPQDPSVSYAKRVVGLPGEQLVIRDSAIWINGQRVEPPDSIRGIRYSPTVELQGRVISGLGSQPVELGPDEYFVIGDFVDLSFDSRFWEQGAPGHPRYWPISRWASLR